MAGSEAKPPKDSINSYKIDSYHSKVLPMIVGKMPSIYLIAVSLFDLF